MPMITKWLIVIAFYLQPRFKASEMDHFEVNTLHVVEKP